MPDDESVPFNQETDPLWNRKPGVVAVPGSAHLMELAKFEQFHSKWTAGTNGPGNPHQHREFPMMVYRAERFNGSPACMLPAPNAGTFVNPGEYQQAENIARMFTERCQHIVKDEQELQRMKEDNWRESPQEAIDALVARDRERSTETAHRNFDDKDMSELAKREVARAIEAAGGEHVPEVKETRKAPRKNASKGTGSGFLDRMRGKKA